MRNKLSVTRIWFGSLGWVCGGLFSLLDSPEKYWMVGVYSILFFISCFILDKIYGEDK